MSKTVEVSKVTPHKDQLLSFKRNVLCKEEGCSKSFIHDGALRMHLVKSHGHIQTEGDKRLFHNRKRGDQDVIFQFHCPDPGCVYGKDSHKHFSTYSLVKQHYIKVHAERRFKCEKCEQAFQLERDLRRHSTRCGVLYQCDTCPVKYTTTEALITHCKRQDHVYPEKYRRQKVEKRPRQHKTVQGKETVVHITTHPVILLNVNLSQPAKIAPVAPIRPKPTLPPTPVTIATPATPASINSQEHAAPEQLVDENDVNGQGEPTEIDLQSDLGNDNATVDLESNIGLDDATVDLHRHNAIIQTDIYGVKHLAVTNKNNFHGNDSGVVEGQDQGESIPLHTLDTDCVSELCPPQKTEFCGKRKLSLPQTHANSVVPKKRQMTASTGMQTSMSLTGKKRLRSVCGTQTTGDYILQTAMARANIRVERRTVASQVTPQKSFGRSDQKNICSTETQTLSGQKEGQEENEAFRGRNSRQSPPVLVDFFSQVRERHIWAETCHTLAEQQTMTDLPFSTATQTLQSYLENLKERHYGNVMAGQDSEASTSEFVPGLAQTEQNIVMGTGCDASIATDIVQSCEAGAHAADIQAENNVVEQQGPCFAERHDVFEIGAQELASEKKIHVVPSKAKQCIKKENGADLRYLKEQRKCLKPSTDVGKEGSEIADSSKQSNQTNKANVVKIFGENLDSSVEFVLPADKVIGSKRKTKTNEASIPEPTSEPVGAVVSQACNSPGSSDKVLLFQNQTNSATVTMQPVSFSSTVAGTNFINTGTSMSLASWTPDTVTPDTVTPDTVTPDTVTPDTVTTDTVTPDTVTPDSVTTDTVTPDTVTTDTVTTDTEAQTMTAWEFNQLLESSGIFLHDELVATESESLTKVATSTNVGTSNILVNTSPVLGSEILNDLGDDFDFLTSVPTIDMNTQTVTDFSLFEDCVAMDTNTQTAEGEVDLLDLVMTNMETQTLNEDDMISLGLLDSSPLSAERIGTVTLGVGTSEGSVSQGVGTFEGTVSQGVGTFEGSVSQSVGTFEGSVSQGVGTFEGTVSQGVGTFEGTVSQGVGTFEGYSKSGCWDI